MNKLITIAILCSLSVKVTAQLNSYTVQQADSLNLMENRHMVIFIHTDWCKYCQAMKNTTFKNDSIIQLLNKEFYFVSFNAESKEDIKFNGHYYKNKPYGNNTSVHELAEALGSTDGKIAYPTLCILNEKYEIIFRFDQFLSAVDLAKVLLVILEK